jgi:hypothetical protein
MTLPLLLDTNVLGQLVQPVVEENRLVVATVTRLFEDIRYQVAFLRLLIMSSAGSCCTWHNIPIKPESGLEKL